jgi:isocitrate dehydrogenase kinase/phosphatase
MLGRRGRYADLISRQLDLFEREHADVIREAQERLALYNAAERDEAEELYGDYVDALETGTEALADLRDHFARTLDDDAAERYEREFNRAVAKRLAPFALDLENR